MGGQDKLLYGRWALITGATGGIGRAISLAFAEHGKAIQIFTRSGDRQRRSTILKRVLKCQVLTFGSLGGTRRS